MEELVTSGQMGQTTLCKGVARGKVYTKRSKQLGVSRKNNLPERDVQSIFCISFSRELLSGFHRNS